MSRPTYELHDELERLSRASADRDVLVSVAATPEASLGEVRRPVETDYAEATQLDRRSFPRPLVDALETVRSLLNEYDELPENGLAVYVGVVDGDLETAVFDDPPAPVATGTYEHANAFDLDPLEAVTGPSHAHGLLVVERGGAALGRLADEGVEPVETFESDVPGKSSAGGQSAERFERDRERRKREFFDEVGERAQRAFLGGGAIDRATEPGGAEADGEATDAADDEDDGGVEAILLGGTTGTVEGFRDEADLDPRLEERLLDESFAVEYASEQGLRQLAEKGRDALDERERRGVRDDLERFFEGLRDDEVPVAYGRDEVDDALAYDAVETALLSTALPGSTLRTLGERTDDQGGDAVVVPDDFSDGERFAEAFDGAGALLRFPIE